MTRIRIRNARLIDPASGLDRRGDVCIADGVLVGVGEPPADFSAERSIDADGHLVCPGLIDLAARTGEPGPVHGASIATEAHAAAAAGITTLACPPDTGPPIDTPSIVELIHQRAQRADGARVIPIGALTRGLAGEHLAEMASLQAAGCPAVADGGRGVRDSLVLRRALEYAATLQLPVMLTPADPWLAEAGCMHEGSVATRLGLPGIPAAAEAAGLGRVLAVAETVGGPVHVGRLSALAALRPLTMSRDSGLPVTADVAIHQLFLTEQDAAEFDTRFHLTPPLRSTSDRDALRAAVADGRIQVICSDHTPLDPDHKDGPFESARPGASGLDTLLPLVLRLVDEGVTDLHRALASVTIAPAMVLGLDSGRLQVGAPADVIVVDPDTPWWCRPETLRSGGHNSPFLGWELTGRCTHAIVGGRLVHEAAVAE
jgi:dihydroorotase